MKLHEKSLELNITHELLNLADSWYWFLVDISLWKYWTPEFRFPFIYYPKSTAAGLHITTEGKDDPSGEAGGGYDVRIKTGAGGRLLFIQYKKGELIKNSPNPNSIFATKPHEHFKFNINSTRTNQHFVLRKLADGIGKKKGNAVVYAFPLIADMKEMEAYAGKLIRKTKFISILDIDKQAEENNVKFEKGKEHNFRVGKYDLNRCEVNYYYYAFPGSKDKSSEIISDIITTRFQKTLAYFIKNIKEYCRKHNHLIELGKILLLSFRQYIRYLLYYFEVSPAKLEIEFVKNYSNQEEFNKYKNTQRDIEILTTVFTSLHEFEEYINMISENPEKIFETKVPKYTPKILITADKNNEINIKFDNEISKEVIEDVTYLIF